MPDLHGMDEKNLNNITQEDLPQAPSPVVPSENYLVAEALQKMPSLASRGLFYLVMFALMTGLAYSLLAKIDVVTQCRAIAVPAVSPVTVQASRTGYVGRIYVAEGQRVEKDSPLFSIRPRTITGLSTDGMVEFRDAAASSSAIHRGTSSDAIAETIVTSPVRGTVVQMFISYPGAKVEESAPLCNILPPYDRLTMNIRATNQEIGFIDTGMEIKYKFDAFPYTDYGSLYGRVMDIPEAAVGDESTGLSYLVRGALDKSYFEFKGKKYLVRAGMTATAELVRERRSVFAMLFKRTGG